MKARGMNETEVGSGPVLDVLQNDSYFQLKLQSFRKKTNCINYEQDASVRNYLKNMRGGRKVCCASKLGYVMTRH